MSELYIVDSESKSQNEEAKRYYFKAQEALKSGKFLKAIHYLKKSIEKKPDYVPSYRSLGEIYHQYNDFQNAQRYIQKAIEIDPNDPVSLFTQGVILMGCEDIPAALGFFERARKAGELTWSLMYNIGLCNYFMGNLESSIQLLNQAIEKDSSQIQPYMLLARIYISLNMRDRARELLKKAKRLRPADSQLDLMISELLGENGL